MWLRIGSMAMVFVSEFIVWVEVTRLVAVCPVAENSNFPPILIYDPNTRRAPSRIFHVEDFPSTVKTTLVPTFVFNLVFTPVRGK